MQKPRNFVYSTKELH